MIIAEKHARSGSYGISDGRTNHDYTRTFLVNTLNPLAGPITAMMAVGINLGDQYVSFADHDDYSFCSNLTATGDDTYGNLWTVTVQYSKYDRSYNQENPLYNAPVISWEMDKWTKPIDEDINGYPILNSASCPYDPAIERDMSRPVLRIVRSEALEAGLTNPDTGDPIPVFDPAWTFSYCDNVNDASWAGADAYMVKLDSINATQMYDPGCGKYMQVSYEFAFAAGDSWKKKVLDAGLYYLDDDDKLAPILDADGSPVTTPVPLDDGEPVPPPVDASNMGVIEYEIYPETDFSAFGFDPYL